MGRKKLINPRIIYFEKDSSIDGSGKLCYIGKRGQIDKIIPFENKLQLDLLLKSPIENTEDKVNFPKIELETDQLNKLNPAFAQENVVIQSTKLEQNTDHEEYAQNDDDPDSVPIIVESSITEPVIPISREYNTSTSQLY
ncbi:hypothetical protein TVAG_020540 [Trichomonas vaginalis G3]|uniref:Uncharacterized protein n=1 Tax=Trichomonas vaginalis (strain ATCC PRA-98 / G3) TaxID=412133 RepID=A2EXW8_TRIV3|nr:hypothetical protein TVAGG3_0317990 [Trichomonas vaginalis G3]EAY02501.1 hypothetical protein TVAG_020540 [Trichomonas vaginalis G3]KAI5529077.1 hypothetical protein TVAGG3_0317990 [Trichomonas vaginalis G3]|eukprot:XP_001314740.1 hypothetical protein [Trichomonas vaginalis G3]